jgi:hypothetical protein
MSVITDAQRAELAERIDKYADDLSAVLGLARKAKNEH